MIKFKLKISKDGVQAPSMVVEASNFEEAKKKGKEKSGLGRFKSWDFQAITIK